MNYNDQLSDLEALKSKINQVRIDKKIFDKIYSELQIELELKKAKLKSILEKSKSAQEEISEGKLKLEEFKQEVAVEKENFAKQVELGVDLSSPEARDNRLKELFEQFMAQSSLQCSKFEQTNHVTGSCFSGLLYPFLLAFFRSLRSGQRFYQRPPHYIRTVALHDIQQKKKINYFV